MELFHGHSKTKLILEKHINSRYGFPCIFFASNKNLALNFGKNIVQIEAYPDNIIDFKGKISHSLEFRNLIHKIRATSASHCLIKNVYDRPNEDFPLEKSDIYVVFDFNIIKEI